MINLKFKKFIQQMKKAHKVNLSVAEMENLRKSFLNESGIHVDKKTFVESPFSGWTVFLWSSRARVLVASFLVIVLVGSGVVFAAGQSLPGSILYPIKTKVNEKVVKFFTATTPQEKEKFEINLVDKRLVEAEKLDQKNNLDNGQKNEIKKQVIDQTIKAEGLIRENINASDKRNLDENENKNNNPTNIEFKNNPSEEKNKKSEPKPKLDNQNEDQNIDQNVKQGQDLLEKVLEKHQDIIQKLDLGHKGKN